MFLQNILNVWRFETLKMKNDFMYWLVLYAPIYSKNSILSNSQREHWKSNSQIFTNYQSCHLCLLSPCLLSSLCLMAYDFSKAPPNTSLWSNSWNLLECQQCGQNQNLQLKWSASYNLKGTWKVLKKITSQGSQIFVELKRSFNNLVEFWSISHSSLGHLSFLKVV